MWFLEHESLFEGKRVWLRPGSQHLFGRTKHTDKDSSEGKKVYIDNKNVSRKHVMLKVHEVQPGNGSKLHTRSQVEITDLSCRQGTTVDGKQILKSQKNSDGTIAYETTTLTGGEHTFRLSQSYPEFKITWQPTVITYASKENRESKARSERLHALDIKTTTDFMFDRTTHVVSTKRNLPKVLSALVSGKHVITSEFLEAVLNVGAASSDEEGIYIPSKLEEDFDAWWPKEKEYIPPAGAEPVPRPDRMLEPDPSRSEVFKGLTFVFLNEAQFTSLHEPISGGSGKALLFDVHPGETGVNEYVEYVHNVAGQKKSRKASEGKLPVVTVRLSSYPDGMEDWAANFVTGVDQTLNQRSILQNEFLDVIISKDTSSLQRPPTEVEVSSSAPVGEASTPFMPESTPVSQPQAPSQAPESSAHPIEEPAKTIPRKRPNRRLGTQSRFTGFDDYEPPPKVRKVEDTQMEETPAMTTQEPSDVAMAEPTPPSPVEQSVEAADQMTELFPAAAEMRRRRAVTRAMSASVEPEAGGPGRKSRGAEALEKLQRAKRKADKEINVREQARLRIKEEEDRRKADEENLREALEGIDIAEIRGLAKIEEMEVNLRTDRPSTQNIAKARSDRWNPDWNGRRNFKKFRRRGVEQGVQTSRVIVALEEAPPKKGFGVGDALFLEEPEPSSRSRTEEQQTKARQIRGFEREVDEDDESEPEAGGFSRRRRGKGRADAASASASAPAPSPAPEVVNVEDSGLEDEEEGHAPPPTTSRTTQRSSGRTQRIEETQISNSTTQQQAPVPEPPSTRKRGPASSVVAGQPAAKRGRVTRRERDEDSDEEETGFRFRRNRR